MPTVYIRENPSHSRQRPRFHRSLDCVYLRKRPAKGENRETLAVELAELERFSPCRSCYPDVPRIKIARRYCPLCNKSCARPCEHNGGVLVTRVVTTTTQNWMREPGDTYTMSRYVWPDRAHLYDTSG